MSTRMHAQQQAAQPEQALQRNQLVWISASGWHAASTACTDAVTQGCIDYWRVHGLPLVVTRQNPAHQGLDHIALGLPAPQSWERRRIALSMLRESIESVGEFPSAWEVAQRLDGSVRQACEALHNTLAAHGFEARIHGSYGWQHLTDLAYVREISDLDLSVKVASLEEADVAANLLHDLSHLELAMDGELVWPDGQAVAWKEWRAWRASRVKSILVKHVRGHHLVHDNASFKTMQPLEAQP